MGQSPGRGAVDLRFVLSTMTNGTGRMAGDFISLAKHRPARWVIEAGDQTTVILIDQRIDLAADGAARSATSPSNRPRRARAAGGILRHPRDLALSAADCKWRNAAASRYARAWIDDIAHQRRSGAGPPALRRVSPERPHR